MLFSYLIKTSIFILSICCFVGCGIRKWACSDYEGFVSTCDRPGQEPFPVISPQLSHISRLINLMSLYKQGTIVDRIDYNIQSVATTVEEGLKQLEKVLSSFLSFSFYTGVSFREMLYVLLSAYSMSKSESYY